MSRCKHFSASSRAGAAAACAYRPQPRRETASTPREGATTRAAGMCAVVWHHDASENKPVISRAASTSSQRMCVSPRHGTSVRVCMRARVGGSWTQTSADNLAKVSYQAMKALLYAVVGCVPNVCFGSAPLSLTEPLPWRQFHRTRRFNGFTDAVDRCLAVLRRSARAGSPISPLRRNQDGGKSGFVVVGVVGQSLQPHVTSTVSRTPRCCVAWIAGTDAPAAGRGGGLRAAR